MGALPAWLVQDPRQRSCSSACGESVWMQPHTPSRILDVSLPVIALRFCRLPGVQNGGFLSMGA
jgi:hypothetical protein